MKIKESLFAFWKTRPVAASLFAGVLALGIGLGGYWGMTALLDPYACRMASGVTIGGLDVSGMTRLEAHSAVKDALEEGLYTQPLTVSLPGETLSLSPRDSGVRVSLWKAVSAAYGHGRKEDAPSAISLLPYLKQDQEAIQGLLQASAARQDTDLAPYTWTLTGQQPALGTDAFDPSAPGQTLVLTLGIPQVRLDVSQVYGQILEAFASSISLCKEGRYQIAPEVVPQAVPDTPDMAAILNQVAVEAADDSLDLENHCFVPGSYGYGFDPEKAQALVSEAGYGETLEIPLSPVEPEILGEEVYFRDLLGSCETKHNTDENRNTNLRLLCQALDGYILQPGEEFSYNGAVGERTAERGYKPATAYSGKRMVKDIGGGVCQGSSTLYNCALLADVEILERVCHGAKVTYLPLGLDAAVNWNTKTDLRFKNNFHFPMMIKAEVSDGYVRMQLLGTDEKDYYVEMRCISGSDDVATYASSYKYKYSKATGQLLSKELEARSSYYELS